MLQTLIFDVTIDVADDVFRCCACAYPHHPDEALRPHVFPHHAAQ
jgi:hypothetical protein